MKGDYRAERGRFKDKLFRYRQASSLESMKVMEE